MSPESASQLITKELSPSPRVTRYFAWLVVFLSFSGMACIAIARGRSLIDLEVYRAGIHAVLHQIPLYGGRFLTNEITLPFTYPPFSIIALFPLGLANYSLTKLWWTSLSLVFLLSSTLILFRAARGQEAGADDGFLRRCFPAPTQRWQWALLLLCPWLEPVHATAFFGQINLALLWLVLVDFLVLRTRRGYLTGLAIAIKLTPAVFIAIPFLRGDWRHFSRILGGAVGATALAFILEPHNSWTYFTSVLWQTDRIGNPGYIGNQSLKGMFTRLDLSSSVWLLTVIVVLLIGVVSTWWGWRQRPERTVVRTELRDVAVWATIGLLCSPVSWTHHWVWALPFGCWAVGFATYAGSHSASEHHRMARWFGSAVGISGLILALTSLPWRGESQANLLSILASNSYVIWAGLGLVGLLIVLWKPVNLGVPD